ncbi:MAG TPA: AEC family transporter [Stellaceae bacterium]
MATVITILLPVFGLVLAGFVTARTRLLSREGIRGLAIFVYYLAIPALLFRSTSAGIPGTGDELTLVLAYFIGTVALFGAAMLAGAWRFGLGLREQSVMAINAAFGNTVQMGAPIILAAFGPPGMKPLTLIIALHSVVLLTLATIVIELGRGRGGSPGHALRAAGRAIAGNPIILAIAAGFLWSRLGLALPRAVAGFLDLLAPAAGPCALFTLGASLSGFRLAAGFGETFVIVVLKLVTLPLLVWALAKIFALSRLDTAVAVVTAALPVGMNAFIFAQRYDIYVARSASAVVLSNLLSAATLAIVLALFAT